LLIRPSTSSTASIDRSTSSMGQIIAQLSQIAAAAGIPVDGTWHPRPNRSNPDPALIADTTGKTVVMAVVGYRPVPSQ
jgi:hypothetical protein